MSTGLLYCLYSESGRSAHLRPQPMSAEYELHKNLRVGWDYQLHKPPLTNGWVRHELVVKFWVFFMQCSEEKLMSSVNKLIGFSTEVTLCSFVTLAPVIKRGMGLTDIRHSDVKMNNY